jgi:hypothetical protein
LRPTQVPPSMRTLCGGLLVALLRSMAGRFGGAPRG